MRRREFTALLGGAATWPLAARAQQRATPVIGYMDTASASTTAHLVGTLRRGRSLAECDTELVDLFGGQMRISSWMRRTFSAGYKAGFTEVAFAAGACNLLRAASDAGGCRDCRGGDGSDVPSAGMRLYQTASLFCRSNHPHRLCADMRMSGLVSIAQLDSDRREEAIGRPAGFASQQASARQRNQGA